jgi:hypothetical protein
VAGAGSGRAPARSWHSPGCVQRYPVRIVVVGAGRVAAAGIAGTVAASAAVGIVAGWASYNSPTRRVAAMWAPLVAARRAVGLLCALVAGLAVGRGFCFGCCVRCGRGADMLEAVARLPGTLNAAAFGPSVPAFVGFASPY